MKPPRLCSCGKIVASGVRCTCQQHADKARKARHDRTRPTAAQRGYNHEWRKARTEFLSLNPYCALCGNHASVVDHITPHRGNMRIFWQRTNWQPLCKPCHDRHKQRVERAAP